MRRHQILIFGGSFFVALAIFMPLSVALSMVSQGLSARAATGTIWSGRLIDAQLGRLPLGDVSVKLSFLELLRGRTSVSMQSALGRGVLMVSEKNFVAMQVTADLDGSRLFPALAIGRLNLTNVNVAFDRGRCIRGEGRVRATFSRDVGGLSLPQGLSGIAQCQGSAILLPLVSQSAMEKLNLHLQSDGGYRAEFFVRATDPAQSAKLNAAGFVPVRDGFVLRLAGKL